MFRRCRRSRCRTWASRLSTTSSTRSTRPSAVPPTPSTTSPTASTGVALPSHRPRRRQPTAALPRPIRSRPARRPPRARVAVAPRPALPAGAGSGPSQQAQTGAGGRRCRRGARECTPRAGGRPSAAFDPRRPGHYPEPVHHRLRVPADVAVRGDRRTGAARAGDDGPLGRTGAGQPDTSQGARRAPRRCGGTAVRAAAGDPGSHRRGGTGGCLYPG